jgi:hypothetical protein
MRKFGEVEVEVGVAASRASELYWADKNGARTDHNYIFVGSNIYIHTETLMYGTTDLPSVATKSS